jgi:hypothetical protein
MSGFRRLGPDNKEKRFVISGLPACAGSCLDNKKKAKNWRWPEKNGNLIY